jgi:CRISPR system Cascade subunit CasD
MAAHLVFTICAQLGAWGAPSTPSANQAMKPTDLHPGRSAVAGLLGAALGVDRERLGDLGAAIRIAVRTDVRPEPQPINDYHTIMPGIPPEGRERWSRLEETRRAMSGMVEGAILSSRAFWDTGVWTVAVHAAEGSGFEVGAMAAALREPRWPLYAGRKAFPLAWDVDPQVVEADGPVEALRGYRWLAERHPSLEDDLPEPNAQRPLHFDMDYPGAPPAIRMMPRTDVPVVRRTPDGHLLRLFMPRQEAQAHVSWGGSDVPDQSHG